MAQGAGTQECRVWIGIGSNQKSPRHQVARALGALAASADIELQAWSSAYRTRPWGVTDQPDFVNAVARVATRMESEALLDLLQALESAAGRVRTRRWGPRSLDLDILLHERPAVCNHRLEIPHPRISQRLFVLAPLLEIDPDISIPGHGAARDLADRLDDSDILSVHPLAPMSGAGQAP